MVQTDTWKENDTIKFLKVHGLAIRGFSCWGKA